jgi:hypothetical protein
MMGQEPEQWVMLPEPPDAAAGRIRDGYTVLLLGSADAADLVRRVRDFVHARRVIACVAASAAEAPAESDSRVVIVQADPWSARGREQVLGLAECPDVINDAGAVGPEATIDAFARYWPYLAHDGVYIIEGLHRGEAAVADVGAAQPPSVAAFVKALWDAVRLNQCSDAGSRAGMVVSFADAFGIDLPGQQLASMGRVELSATRCVIRKAGMAGAEAVAAPRSIAAGGALAQWPDTGHADAGGDDGLANRNHEVFALEQEIRSLSARCDALAAAEAELQAMRQSASWRWTRPLRVLLGLVFREPAYVAQLREVMRRIAAHPLAALMGARFHDPALADQDAVVCPRQRRDVSVDVVVWVDGQATLVRQCLEAVLRSTLPPYRLFLIDVSSRPDVHAYLEGFAATHGAQVVPHAPALGLERALSSALGHSDGGWIALLRDDAIVSEGWLDGLMQVAATDPRTALVSPLTTDLLRGVLPAGAHGALFGATTGEPAAAEDIAGAAFRVGCRQPIGLPRVDGACVLMRRELLHAAERIGGRAWSQGLPTRAARSHWLRRARLRPLLADDVYVQTGSTVGAPGPDGVPDAARAGLQGGFMQAGRAPVPIMAATDACRPIALAATAGRIAEEIDWLQGTPARNPLFEGRRVAFVCGAEATAAGVELFLSQAHALRELGVDAWIVSAGSMRGHSDALWNRSPLPVLAAPSLRDVASTLANAGIGFDAIVAVGLDLLEILPSVAGPIRGCYLPDAARTDAAAGAAHRALLGQSTLGELRLLVQLEHSAAALSRQLGAGAAVVGASIDTALFRPSATIAVRRGVPRISVLIAKDADGARLALRDLPRHLRSRLGLAHAMGGGACR